jgi:hypothetical protein
MVHGPHVHTHNSSSVCGSEFVISECAPVFVQKPAMHFRWHYLPMGHRSMHAVPLLAHHRQISLLSCLVHVS